MLKRKKITLQDCYSLFEKYGDLGLHVNTPYGYKHIEACAVTAYDSEVYQLEAENGLKIDSSPEHLVKLENNEFTKVTEVNVGLDKVQTNEGLSVIKSVTKLPYRKDLLDIQVAEVKQYYSNGIVSHNSTILDALLYLFFGKTIGIQKKEKHGDNRFINNKRDLNYCEVGAYIDLNGEDYLTTRRTERKWNRAGDQLSSCSTTVTYQRIDENGNVVDEAEDKRNKTEKLIQESIGTFDDFLRTSFINADTLNNLLAIDHATFVDSVLRDSGLDIYEKKLKEFKDWKKEVYGKTTRVSTDVVANDEKILELSQLIVDKKAELIHLRETLHEAATRLSKGFDYKETLIKKLYKIDPELASLSLEDIKLEIKGYLDQKKAKEDERANFQYHMEQLKSTFDEGGLKALQDEKAEFNKWVFEQKSLIKNLEVDIMNHENKIHKIEGEKLLKVREAQAEDNRWVQKNKDLDSQIELIKKEIEFLESSMTCPTCLREKDQSTVEGIRKTVVAKDFAISKLDGHDRDVIHQDRKITADNYTQEIDNLELSKQPLLEMIQNVQDNIKGVKDGLASRTIEVDEIGLKIALIEKDKTEVEQRQHLLNQTMAIPAQIELIEMKIENLKTKLNNYENTQLQLRENTKIENQIAKAQERIDELTNTKEETIRAIDNINKVEIVNAERKINELEDLNDKFRKQERRDLVLKIYEDCIHRDGIPTMILKRSLEFINIELENLLDSVNFNVYIDDDLNMRMYDYGKKDADIAVIQGSGMQRTFASLALRLVLRKLNNKSKSNVIMMDEILGKLDQENLELFIELMNKAKDEIEIIVIIEHGYADLINPDHLITVDITDKGISFFDIKY
jgi:DNA repair exonuclease SbcCD ATPase subunit